MDLGFASPPTEAIQVRTAARALGISLADTARTTKTPAFAAPAYLVALLQATAVERRIAEERAGRLRFAYGASRDALFLGLCFLGCLRKSEATALRRSDITITALHIRLFIRRSKTDRDGAGHTAYLPFITAEGINLRDVLLVHLRILDRLGHSDPETRLFGWISDPRRDIQGDSIMARLIDSSRDHLAYYEALDRRGLVLPRLLKRRTHGLRRGGICAIRDHARERGYGSYDLECLLMIYGRWRDPRSVKVYLVEAIPTLVSIIAGHTQPADDVDAHIWHVTVFSERKRTDDTPFGVGLFPFFLTRGFSSSSSLAFVFPHAHAFCRGGIIGAKASVTNVFVY